MFQCLLNALLMLVWIKFQVLAWCLHSSFHVCIPYFRQEWGNVCEEKTCIVWWSSKTWIIWWELASQYTTQKRRNTDQEEVTCHSYSSCPEENHQGKLHTQNCFYTLWFTDSLCFTQTPGRGRITIEILFFYHLSHAQKQPYGFWGGSGRWGGMLGTFPLKKILIHPYNFLGHTDTI